MAKAETSCNRIPIEHSTLCAPNLRRRVAAARGSVDVECRNAVKAKSCALHANAGLLRAHLEQLSVWDLEDLHQLAQEKKGCRFYATRCGGGRRVWDPKGLYRLG